MSKATAKARPAGRRKAESAGIEVRAKQALDYVVNTSKNTTNWMAVFNATFGPGGRVEELFPDEADRIAFTQTPQYRELFETIWSIRRQHGDATEEEMAATKASGAFNLRLPKALHAALVQEADEQGVSLNQLCLAKLAVQLRRAVQPS